MKKITIFFHFQKKTPRNFIFQKLAQKNSFLKFQPKNFIFKNLLEKIQFFKIG